MLIHILDILIYIYIYIYKHVEADQSGHLYRPYCCGGGPPKHSSCLFKFRVGCLSCMLLRWSWLYMICGFASKASI